MKHHDDLQATLYIVASPIGNLSDISSRLIATLKIVDWIACEDTRRTGILLEQIGVKKQLYSFHDFSPEKSIVQLTDLLRQGQSGAYISDAGTPGISDPGALLVEAAFQEKIRVVPIPGPSAVTSILSVSGFSGTRYTFLGFFPRTTTEIQKLCQSMQEGSGIFAENSRIFVFFEAPTRVKKSLEQLAMIFPDSFMVVGRELTKKFEEIKKGTTIEIYQHFLQQEELLGEFTFALEVNTIKHSDDIIKITKDDIKKIFQELHELGANQKILVALGKQLGLQRNEAYTLALDLKK